MSEKSSEGGGVNLPSLKHSDVSKYVDVPTGVSTYTHKHSVALPQPIQKQESKGERGRSDVSVQADTKPHVVYRAASAVVRHHAHQVKCCTWNNFWTNNAAYNHLYLSTLVEDYKTLIEGNEALDRMQFLEDEGHAISETVYALNGEEGIDVLHANEQRLRLSLMIILAFSGFGVVGFMQAAVDVLLAPELTALNIVAFSTSLVFVSVCICYYLSYAYHCYAVQEDRFIRPKEFFQALLKCELKAWLPLVFKSR